MVGQLEHPVGLRESMQPGVGGPGANVLEASALRPGKRAEAPGVATEDETRNTCFLCSSNGQPIDECCIKDVATGEYTPGHGRKRKAVTCANFDVKFPVGDEVANALRKSKMDDAARLRKNALLVFARRNKRSKASASASAAGGP